MKYSEFKDYAAQLGRFASVRENAPEPSDRIVIQCFDGELAFVAGAEYRDEAKATLKVMAGPSSARGMAVVAARPLLQAAKALKGKGEVDVAITDAGVTLTTSAGGEITLPNIATKVPDFLRLDLGTMGYAQLVKGWLGRVSKILGVTLDRSYFGWRQAEFYCHENFITLRGGTGYRHSEFKLDTTTSWPLFRGAVSPDFLDGIKDFDEGYIRWSDKQFVIEADPYIAYTNFMPRFEELPPFPIKKVDTKVEVERKALIESLKTIGGEKIAVSPTNSGIQLAEWPEGKARLTMAAQVTGQGRMATMTEMLTKLATALGGDTLEIEWQSDESGPLWLNGKDGWAILGRVPLT